MTEATGRNLVIGGVLLAITALCMDACNIEAVRERGEVLGKSYVPTRVVPRTDSEGHTSIHVEPSKFITVISIGETDMAEIDSKKWYRVLREGDFIWMSNKYGRYTDWRYLTRVVNKEER